MNTSHFPQDPNLQEPGSPQNPVQETNPVLETTVEATPAAAVPQAIVPEFAAPEATNLEPVAPEAVVPASVAPQLPVTPQTIPAAGARPAIEIRGLTKAFGQKVAVDRINLDIPSGSFYGLVGRNGAGKTTTISMVTGMLMPSEGTAYVRGIDMWAEPLKAKAHLGVLPDGVHLFDKLTGEQLITYSGYLHGIDKETVASRVKDLLTAMDLTDAAGRAVADYSAGMTKKIALAAALVHAPSVLILDEPFEAVDPVSAANIQDILRGFVASGGTVIISSHVMDLVQRLCDHVAVMDSGRILAAGTVDEVRAGMSLEERFVQLVGGRTSSEGLSWLGTSSH
ncbi:MULTISPECIES: ABC transporter ATP-binding protein [Rothia]|jgi:ABC-type multidrug transport system, ATPase component|uniref:ABC transporter ATP-binding protein n=1 Tax=Rothia TaxID=32207 RepID=UPI00066B5A8A|nr:MULTISPECIES: ABC transporter ATP-binding protein [Rothia]MDU2572299.1 ATP-binding cassette domain-containing protein [Rothia mucilaginosa]OFL77923.1 ABC transporter [Rothia sp. HMSC075F09]OFO20454.1 ABC transporter [Rothia sp. HMSC061C12]OFR63862.1 ABC transporter [Rothia sp. HMSC069C04]